jgi:hypothetical protein
VIHVTFDEREVTQGRDEPSSNAGEGEETVDRLNVFDNSDLSQGPSPDGK